MGRLPVRLQPCSTSTSSLFRLLALAPQASGKLPFRRQFLFRYSARSAGNAPLSAQLLGSVPCTHKERENNYVKPTNEMISSRPHFIHFDHASCVYKLL